VAGQRLERNPGHDRPFLAYGYLKYYTTVEFPFTLFGIAGFTTVVWLTGTFLTKPVKREHLLAFYRRVHPGGPGWRVIAAQIPEVKGTRATGRCSGAGLSRR